MTKFLCDTFQELAAETAQRIQLAHQLGLSWSEETITENLLLQLKHRHPREVHIVSFSKRAEFKNGADWEWWFLDRRAGSGLPMRIQAKRIDPDSGRYSSLFYSRRSQIRKLITRARCDKMTPGYVLYSFLPEGTEHGLSGPHFHYTGWNDNYGCLFARAELLEAQKSDYIGKVSPLCRPWHQIVCSCALFDSKFGPPNIYGKSPGLPDIVAAQTAATEFSEDVSSAEVELSPAIWKQIPSYVELATSPDFRGMDDAIEIASACRAAERGVAGLVVIQADEESRG